MSKIWILVSLSYFVHCSNALPQFKSQLDVGSLDMLRAKVSSLNLDNKALNAATVGKTPPRAKSQAVNTVFQLPKIPDDEIPSVGGNPVDDGSGTVKFGVVIMNLLDILSPYRAGWAV